MFKYGIKGEDHLISGCDGHIITFNSRYEAQNFLDEAGEMGVDVDAMHLRIEEFDLSDD